MDTNTPYITPPGYGDTFFQYAYDASALTNGQSPQNLRISIDDGAFLMRHWAGLDTVATSIQIRNRLQRPLNSGSQGANLSRFGSGVPHIPEEYYPDSGYIGFDLYTVAKLLIGGSTFASQLVFSGVRRRQGVEGDPTGSPYEYYEKPYTYSYSMAINQYANVNPNAIFNQLPITDGYDFVLQRIRCVQTPTGTMEGTTPTFKMTLFNGNKEACSNIPIISQRILNFPVQSAPERNYFPTPGIRYRANSAITFNIYSLLLAPTVLPVNYDLEFSGVRRYPCR